uniref:Toll-like receptor 2 n=1 Tax=Melopsittacus undulatus TaxID=13146 RepID=A0A8V5G3H7_MELUD
MRILIGSLHFYSISFFLSGANGFLTEGTPTAYTFPFYNYSYLNLSSISEAGAPRTARALNLSHNAIEKVTKGDLEGFSTLEVLDLSYNRIKDIEPGAFESLPSLTAVDLSFNDKELVAAPEPSAPPEELFHAAILPDPGPRLGWSTVNVPGRGEETTVGSSRAGGNGTVAPTASPRPSSCGEPVNGTLDLSNSKLSEEELMLKLDPDLCQAQLDRIVELNISHSALEMDLLSLFLLFLPIKNMQSVDASYNKLTINILDLDSICEFPSEKLWFVNLSHNPINSLNTLCLPTTIRVIDLSFTNISQIPRNFAKKMLNLEHMYVQGNHFIYTVQPQQPNPLAKPAHGCFHISALSLVRNQAGTPIESLPKNMKHLEMSNCSIVELPEWFAGTMNALLYLDLSSNRIAALPDLPPSLQHLDISSSDIKVIPPGFRSMANLTVFIIHNNKVTEMHPEYFPLTLTKCDISKNKLSLLPLTEALQSLQHLNVSGNLITRLEATSLLPALTNLDSSHNLIAELPDDFGASLPMLNTSISLGTRSPSCSANTSSVTVTCTGSSMSTSTAPQLHIRGKESLMCSFPPDRRGQLVESSHLTLLHCSLGIQMAITACAAILLVLVLTGLCWRFDGLWYVRMGWYWCMAKRKQYEKRPENKPFDAFISYSEPDAEWTKENLLGKLEQDGFKICYHERDFNPGHPVLGNIFYCIENSHKVIFVLSPSFVSSCWCQYELYFAEHRVLNENQDSLIMIVLEELPPHSVPQKFSKLRKLLKRKTYLKWSPEEHKQRMFWRQLEAVLRTTNEPLLRAENGPAQDACEMEGCTEV